MPDAIDQGAADFLANPEEPVLPRLKNSLYFGVQQAPDAYAKTREASRAMNVPLGAALADPAHVNAQRQVENLDPNGMILGTPKTANFLAEPDNAAIAHDDVPQLSLLESLAKTFRNIGEGIAQRDTQLQAGGHRLSAGLEDLDAPFEAARQWFRDRGVPIPARPDYKGQLTKQAEALEAQAAASTYTPGTTFEEVKQAPISKFLPWALEQGVVSLPDMVGSLAAMPLYIATRTGEIGQKRAVNDERGEATVGDLLAAMPAATASALLEKIGTHGILGIDEAVAQGVKGVLKETGKAAVKEGATETGQELVEGLGEQVGTQKGVDVGQLGERMLQAGLAGAGFGGTVRAVGASVQATAGAHQAKIAEAEQATTDAETVGKMMEASKASALRTRDPQTFHDFVAAATQDTPVEKVYVQASDLVETLAQGDPEALKQNAAVIQSMPSVVAQLDDALAGNSLVEIPVSELLAFTPDSSMAQSLIENLKIDPQGMSMRQADEFMQTQAEELKADVAKAIEDGQTVDAFQASSGKVLDRVKTQLDTVNRFTPDVNATNALLLSSFYTTQAANFGVLPEEMAAQHPVTFQSAGIAGESLEQAPEELVRLTDQARALRKARNSAPDQATWDAHHETLMPIAARLNELTGNPLGLDSEEVRARYGVGDNAWKPDTTLSEAAATTFGVTRDPRAAGYILPDGKMLDFSEEGGDGSRTADHRAVSQLLDSSGTEAMTEFMNRTGAARVDFSAGTFEAQRIPSDKAITAAVRAARASGKPLLVEASRPDGSSKASQDFGRPTVEAVRAFFETNADGKDFFQSEKPENPAYYDYSPGLGFQSSLFATIQEKGPAKASAEQWLATLQNAPGVKKEELEWIGLAEALTVMSQDGAITKEQVLTYVAQNGVRLEEIVQSADPAEDAYTEEELDDRTYQLLNDAMPDFDGDDEAEERWSDDNYGIYRDRAEEELREERASPTDFDQYRLPGGENYRELLMIMPLKGHPKDPGGMTNPRLERHFTAGMGHWSYDNVLAHARITDRLDAEGKKVLFVEEIQSDWHQKGREQGYATTASPEVIQAAETRLDQANAALEEEAKTWVAGVETMMRDVLAFMTRFRDSTDIGALERAEAAAKRAAHANGVAPGFERRDVAYAAAADALGDAMSAADAVNSLKNRLNVFESQTRNQMPATGRLYASDAFMQDRNLWPDAAWLDGEGQQILDMRRELRNERENLRTAVLRQGEARQTLERLKGTDGIPNAPFKASWPALVMKRLLKEAVEGGYDKVAWIHGDQQNGGTTEQVEGIKLFYDRNLGNITNDIIKKMGGKVEPVSVSMGVDKGAASGEIVLAWRGVPADQIAPTWAAMTQAQRERAFTEYRARLGDEAQHLGFNVTDQMRAANAAVEPKLFQGEDAGKARGAYTPSTNTITLLRNADLSTTLHELGHFFLETTARLASDANAPAQLKADWATAAKFMDFGGVEPEAWLAIPVDARREGHEKWARGFEVYLREGKAPSAGLTGAFRRFKSWLIHIYQSVTQLNVEINDEVRGVFDRLIATEAEIASAEKMRSFAPAFDTRPEGITEQEWEAYQRLGADATADAQDELGSRSLRDMQWLQNTRMRMIRELTKEAREKRQAVRAEVEAEVYAEPVYSAQRFLKRGITADGSEWEGSHKLDKDAVAEIYEGTPQELQDWRKLGFGKYGMLAEGGLDPDQAAELFGFSSGHELAEALLNAAPVREEIDGRTDQRMMERYGDLKDPQAISKAADEAIHNAARLRFVATEANMAAKAVGKTQVLAEAARDFARDLIGRTMIRNLRPSRYTGAESRAARLAAQAAAKGDMVTVATEKRNQLINGHAAKATYDAQAEVEKALRFLARFQSAATRKGMDATYRDQIDALLERFDLRTGQTLKNIDRRKSLKSWIESQREQGHEPVIDPSLENEAYRKHFRDLTVDEMRGLVDAVKNIAHLGRLKNRLLTAQRDRDFGRTRDAIVERIQDSAYKTLPVQRESNTLKARASANLRGYLAVHRTFPAMIQKMEGLAHKGGVMWRTLVQNKNQAESNEADRRHQATQAMDAIFKKIVDAGGLTKKLFIPEIGTSLSLEGRLAIALNWGNEINRERVMSGEKWNAKQIQAILATLTRDQLQFVNEVHDYLDSFWPEISAKSRRVTGVEPQRVPAEPYELTMADGSLMPMRGGYYPIKYNTERSNRSRADAEAADLMNAKNGLYVRAMTRQGHLKARVESTGRPLRYDLGVAFQHVNEVIHDLAFHEYLIDANKLIGNTEVEAAIKAHYGPEYHQQLVDALKAMALGPQQSHDAASKGLRYLRSATVKSKLAFNLVSVAKQTIGLSQSLVEIGPKYLMHGIGKVLGDAVQFKNTAAEVQAASKFMANRGRTFQREVNEIHSRIRDTVPGAAIEKIAGKGAGKAKRALSQLDAAAFYLMQKMQFQVDMITWLGAHEKALAQGHETSEAVGLADQAVINSQSSGLTGDLATVTRDSEALKLLTSFMGPMIAIYNQMDMRVAETRRVGPARAPLLAAEIALSIALPAVLSVAITKALTGGLDDDDWLNAIGKAGVEQLLGFFVLVRELAPALETAIGIKSYQPNGPPALALITDSYKLAKQVNQGDADSALRAAAVNVTGDLTGIPAVQINRSADGWEALDSGETQNPLALVFGAPK